MLRLVVSFEMEGVHRWEGAPEEFKEFSASHSHIFKFLVLVPIDHSREIELFKLRRDLMNALRRYFDKDGTGRCDFGGMSCEDIAAWIAGYIAEELNLRSTVFVGEDEWMGALLD